MSYTLLLADESVTTQRVLELTFAEHGVRVVGVTDGELALERLRAEPVDIVLADIGLAKITGYELAARIKQEPALASLPVLLLTGAFDTVDEARVRLSGAAGTLVKPLESGFVIKRVKELLGIPGTAAISTAQTHDVTPADVSDEPPAASSDSDAPAAPHPVPPPRDPHIPMPPPAWDQVREEKGLAPDTTHIEPGAGADDYFDRLDAAFDSLDAQLAGTSTRPAARPPQPPVAPAAPAASAPAAVSAPAATPPPASSSEDLAESMGLGGNDWFEKTIAAETAPGAPVAPIAPIAPIAPVAPEHFSTSLGAGGNAPIAPVAPPAPIGPVAPEEINVAAAPPPAPTPVAANVSTAPAPAAASAGSFVGYAQTGPQPVTMVASSSHVADAFESLLAAEQGEVELSQAPTIEISDDVIDRIAARVAEHLTGSLFIETVRSVAGTVTERLVKEEIEKIRSTARAKKQ